MPRRNRPFPGRRRRFFVADPLRPPPPPEMTTDQMAQDLVRRRLASPRILDSFTKERTRQETR